MDRKHAVVTGGAGFIGHHLVHKLLDQGWHVTVLDDLSTGSIDNLRSDDNLDFVKLDISESTLPNIGFNTLFHLAAPVSVPESITNPIKYWTGICLGSQRLMEWAYQMGAKTMVAASTAAVYGDSEDLPLTETDQPKPMSPYAEYKLEMEYMMGSYHSSKFKCTALRFFNVFGEGQRATGGYRSAVPIFLEQYESFKPITVSGDGSQTRDWIYIGDVVDAILASAKKEYNPKMPIYNVGSGQETQVIEVAEAFGGEIIHIEKREEPLRSVANISLIGKQLGWRPKTNLLSWIKSIK